MNVSVVVPAHNEAANISHLLTSLLQQETGRARVIEIVVVASGCTDDTAALAREVARGKPGMHVHVQERRSGKVAAINEYLKLRDPRADVIVLCSADLRVHPDVLERIVEKFATEPKVGMIGARPVPDNDRGQLVGRMVTLLWEMHHRIAELCPKMGELVAFRANLIERVSELSVVDEASIEDVVRSKGYELAYLPGAIVTNHGPENLREYFEQRRRIARGHYWLDFAFGYEVATLDKGLLLRTALDVGKEEDTFGRGALAMAIGTEVLARACGFFDARVLGGKHRTWHQLRSTKTLRTVGETLARATQRPPPGPVQPAAPPRFGPGHPSRASHGQWAFARGAGHSSRAPVAERKRSMSRKLPLLARLAGYRAAHATGRLQQLPVNLTVSVTYSCPSRCLTCDIWKKKVDNLTVDEYAKVFRTLHKVPVWVTLSGGDQFLRADLADIVRLVRTEIEPTIINIPMNGVITERIFDLLPKIAEYSAGAQLVLNLSVDEIGEAHDHLRGAPNNYAKLLEVAALIHDLKKTYDHVVLGVHTVISKFNVDRIPEIAREARAVFEPDSYITEVAENRVELGTLHKGIGPDPADYRRAVRHLQGYVRAHRSLHPVGRLVESLRLEYYDLAATILEENRQVIDCYAGWASAQLAPDGHVWGCCTRAESMGNVRENGYDFGAIWFGKAADEFRGSVKRHECACPLANASYTNLLLDAPSLLRVVGNMAGVG